MYDYWKYDDRLIVAVMSDDIKAINIAEALGCGAVVEWEIDKVDTGGVLIWKFGMGDLRND